VPSRPHATLTSVKDASDQPIEGPAYWSAWVAPLAVACVEHAAKDGFRLVLLPDTPVLPDARCLPPQHLSGTWGEIETLFLHWAAVGCRWVNLRFVVEPGGDALIRYEVRPEGAPLHPGRVTYANGGFDCEQLLSPAEFRRLHPAGNADPI